MTYFTREEWGARPAGTGPGQLDVEPVVGIVLHWPAMQKPLNSVEAVKAALRSWQRYHMDTHGWSDIAYQEAFDNAGNVYMLRGLRVQSGANGDTDSNKRFGSLLLILAPGEEPSEAMVSSVRDRIAKHRTLFHNSKAIKGHSDVRPEPTACPGPIVQQGIEDGLFEPESKVSPRDALRKSITKDIRTAKEQGRPRVVKDLQDARKRIPKDDA